MEGHITIEELGALRPKALKALAKAKQAEAAKMARGYRYVRVCPGTYVLRKLKK